MFSNLKFGKNKVEYYFYVSEKSKRFKCMLVIKTWHRGRVVKHRCIYGKTD